MRLLGVGLAILVAATAACGDDGESDDAGDITDDGPTDEVSDDVPPPATDITVELYSDDAHADLVAVQSGDGEWHELTRDGSTYHGTVTSRRYGVMAFCTYPTGLVKREVVYQTVEESTAAKIVGCADASQPTLTVSGQVTNLPADFSAQVQSPYYTELVGANGAYSLDTFAGLNSVLALAYHSDGSSSVATAQRAALGLLTANATADLDIATGLPLVLKPLSVTGGSEVTTSLVLIEGDGFFGLPQRTSAAGGAADYVTLPDALRSATDDPELSISVAATSPVALSNIDYTVGVVIPEAMATATIQIPAVVPQPALTQPEAGSVIIPIPAVTAGEVFHLFAFSSTTFVTVDATAGAMADLTSVALESETALPSWEPAYVMPASASWLAEVATPYLGGIAFSDASGDYGTGNRHALRQRDVMAARVAARRR